MCPTGDNFLEFCPAGNARKRQYVSDVRHPRDVHKSALKAQTETRVWHASILANVEIPLIVFDVFDSHAAHSFDKHVVTFLTLAPTDDLSDLGNQNVHRAHGFSVIVHS